MAHRTVLTTKQYAKLLGLPSDEVIMRQHYVLSDEDIKHIKQQRKSSNRLGYAIQLCALRFPGRYISSHETIPKGMITFIGAQIGISNSQIEAYATRNPTRYDHLASIKEIYGFRSFEKQDMIAAWLAQTAQHTKNNLQLAERFIKKCRSESIIIPAISTIERLCSNALIKADRDIAARVTSRLDNCMKNDLYSMLEETVDGRLTVYAWLRRYEIGNNSADANKLIDRLEYLQELGIPNSVLEGIPEHRIVWLRQQGEAYYADGLREINEDRRLAILAVCAVEWKATITDTILETHDRVVGRSYNECTRMRDTKLLDQKKLVKDTLKSFIQFSNKLLDAHDNDISVSEVIDDAESLETLIATATILTQSMVSEPLDFVLSSYNRLRRYTQRMLEAITFEGHKSSGPLLEAIHLLKSLNQQKKKHSEILPTDFFSQRWRKQLGHNPELKLWEIAVLFSIREALRSRDIWVNDSRKYQDSHAQLLPIDQAKECLLLSIPLKAKSWITQRKSMLENEMKKVNRMIREGTLVNSTIDKGVIRIDRLKKDIPNGIDEFTMEVYRQLPQVSITDILKEVDKDTGFTDAFTHLYTGSPCKDKIGLLNVLLAGGINLGLKKMAACSNSHTSFWPLLRISQWHVNSEASKTALAMVINAHQELPFSQIWGNGKTSSSDGQFFPVGGAGEAMNLVNTRYGNTPGIKAYTHLSGQYAPFALQTIPATIHEAPYIIDGLTMNETGKQIKEHYADTGGFTDHVFAICSLLGYEFAPRLRNISSLKLYGIKGTAVPKLLKELITAKANITNIEKQWPDIIRLVASIITNRVVPSQALRQLASFPRQNELAIALKEIGKIERTIFILKWISSTELQRRAQLGLNKGEAHHALKRALNFNRRGEICDSTLENQHLRMMNLNLLATIIIYWNTKHLGRIIHDMKQQGRIITAELLAHLSPLGWEHIIINGFYKW